MSDLQPEKKRGRERLKRAGKVVVDNAGMVAGVSTIELGGRLIHRQAQGLAAWWRRQTTKLSDEELAERRAEMDARLAAMPQEEIDAARDGWRRASRIAYVSALIPLVVGCYFFFPEMSNPMSLLVAVAFSFYLLVRGIKGSYRSWQIENRVYFQPGSFARWWKTGSKIV